MSSTIRRPPRVGWYKHVNFEWFFLLRLRRVRTDSYYVSAPRIGSFCDPNSRVANTGRGRTIHRESHSTRSRSRYPQYPQ